MPSAWSTSRRHPLFAASVLARVPGATVTFARASGLTSLTRTIITNTGTAAVNIFDRTLVQAVRIATAAGTAVRDSMEMVITPQRIDAIVHFLFNRSEQQKSGRCVGCTRLWASCIIPSGA